MSQPFAILCYPYKYCFYTWTAFPSFRMNEWVSELVSEWIYFTDEGIDVQKELSICPSWSLVDFS